MKKFYYFLLIISLIACTKKEESNVSSEDVSKSTSVIYDSKLGLWVASNFYDYDFTWVKSVNDLPVPEKAFKSKTMKVMSIPQGRIVDIRTIYCGTNPYYPGLEAWADVPDGYVCTGIGARVNSSDNVKTLTLEYRYIYDNGTMGPRYRCWYAGSDAEIQYTPSETWYAAPDGAVVIGVGFRANSTDMKTQWTYYRYLNKSTIRLSGGYTLVQSGSQPSNNCEAIYMPWENGLDMDRAVITGVKLRCEGGSNITTLVVNVGMLK